MLLSFFFMFLLRVSKPMVPVLFMMDQGPSQNKNSTYERIHLQSVADYFAAEEAIEKMLKKNLEKVKTPPGYDERHQQNKTRDHEVVLNITQFVEKMKLMNFLENKNHTVHEKVSMIEEYNKVNEPSPMKTNIRAGGIIELFLMDIF